MHGALIAPIALLLLATSLGAQAVHPGKVVRVRAPSVLLDRFEGVFIGRSGDTLLFGDDKRGPVRVPLSAITQLEVSAGKSRLRGALRGALWGGSIGLSATAIGNLDPPLAEPDTSKDVPLVEGLWAGALTGALIGVFVPKRVWRQADPRILLTVAPTIERGATAVSANEPAPAAVQPSASRRAGATPTVEMTFGGGGESAAQERAKHEREGWWLAVGFGSAWNDLQCSGCTFTGQTDGWRGGAGSGAVYAVGRAITPRLLVGVELNPSGTGTGERRERNAIIFMLLGVVQYYPWNAAGFHVTAGVGPTSVGLEGMGGGAENGGLAAQLGLGYDIRFRRLRSVSLTPYGTYSLTKFRDGPVRTSGNAGSITGLQNRSVRQFGVALRWY